MILLDPCFCRKFHLSILLSYSLLFFIFSRSFLGNDGWGGLGTGSVSANCLTSSFGNMGNLIIRFLVLIAEGLFSHHREVLGAGSVPEFVRDCLINWHLSVDLLLKQEQSNLYFNNIPSLRKGYVHCGSCGSSFERAILCEGSFSTRHLFSYSLFGFFHSIGKTRTFGSTP